MFTGVTGWALAGAGWALAGAGWTLAGAGWTLAGASWTLAGAGWTLAGAGWTLAGASWAAGASSSPSLPETFKSKTSPDGAGVCTWERVDGLTVRIASFARGGIEEKIREVASLVV